MLELQRDWAHKDTYDAVMDIVKTHYGAYGIGVEYVYTMVHKAPPTVFSRVRDPVGRDSPLDGRQARIAHEGVPRVPRRRPPGRRRLQPARRPVSGPPVVALIGLLGILLGEQIIPVGRQMISGAPSAPHGSRCGVGIISSAAAGRPRRPTGPDAHQRCAGGSIMSGTGTVPDLILHHGG